MYQPDVLNITSMLLSNINKEYSNRLIKYCKDINPEFHLQTIVTFFYKDLLTFRAKNKIDTIEVLIALNSELNKDMFLNLFNILVIPFLQKYDVFGHVHGGLNNDRNKKIS